MIECKTRDVENYVGNFVLFKKKVCFCGFFIIIKNK